MKSEDDSGQQVRLSALVRRLRELADAVTQGSDAVLRETSMRVPAEPYRDADIVLSQAADEIEAAILELDRLGKREAILERIADAAGHYCANYMLDEAECEDVCVSAAHHEAAKALANAIGL